MPIAGFHGRRRLLRLDSDGPATLEILDGMVRGVAQESPVCRITLQGPDAWLQATSLTMAEALPLSVPLASLPVEAMALARGLPCPARHSGGPVVVPGSSVGASISLIIGHLTDVILASVPDVVAAQSPDPVHGMRVAIRRLRSAFSIFRRAADGPAFGAIQQPLRDLAILLGVARDWDVFLAGTGADVAAAFEGDRRISAMLVTAAKQRDAAYAGLRRFFASPEYRQIALSLVHLSALDLWRAELDEEHRAALEEEIGPYATALLTKRHAQMLRPGRDISDLPVEELHDLRKQGKRLRYAAEFFAPLYGRNDTKRFIRRVSDLQEELGHLNDGAAAASLMEALHGSLFAAGVVQGFTAARAGDVRAGIAGAWSKFRKAEPFWS
jgi:CHAD domain-containing protein